MACGGAGDDTPYGDQGAGGHGSSDALVPDADSGAEDGATGEDAAAPVVVCAPGKVEACPCPSGAWGAQECASDGQGFGPCECTAPDAGDEDAGIDAAPDAPEPDPDPVEPDGGGEPPTDVAPPEPNACRGRWPFGVTAPMVAMRPSLVGPAVIASAKATTTTRTCRGLAIPWMTIWRSCSHPSPLPTTPATPAIVGFGGAGRRE